MRNLIIMQTSGAERMQSITRYLSREGSSWELLAVVLGLLVLVALTAVLYTLDRRRRRQYVREPRGLFRRLQAQLDLPLRQRDLLRRLVADLRLENPTILLLGRSVFEGHAKRWLQCRRRVRDDDQEHLASLSAYLFPPV